MRDMMKVMNWMQGYDTGISSKAIVAAMTGLECSDGDVPHDPNDFGRCHRLLLLMPEWVDELHKVADRFPKWRPMVDAWPELTSLYEAELAEGTGKAPRLFARMKELYALCMTADGWERTGPNSWRKKTGGDDS